MQNKSVYILPMILASLMNMSGCATEGIGGGDYSRSQTRGEQRIRMGTVAAVRTVKIEGTRSGIGTVAGAGLGGLAGSEIGMGKGSIAGSVGGAIVGAMIGQAAEQFTTKQDGIEITINLDNGELIAVTQGADEQFNIGDRVRVLSGGGATRVSH